MMGERFILDANGNPQEEPDLMTWARWIETADRCVARTAIGSVVVSTIFLGLDHSFGGGPPILFETMVFNGSDDMQQRYCTVDAARAGHAEVVASIRAAHALVAVAPIVLLEAPAQTADLVLICQQWEESERGWGCRPDGFSLHRTEADRKAFVEAYWARMPNRAPSEYSRPTGTPYHIPPTPEQLARVEASANGARFYDSMPAGARDGWAPG